jgi:hypothetical protein
MVLLVVVVVAREVATMLLSVVRVAAGLELPAGGVLRAADFLARGAPIWHPSWLCGREGAGALLRPMQAVAARSADSQLSRQEPRTLHCCLQPG